jgi:peptide/nickel transport system permease protein
VIVFLLRRLGAGLVLIFVVTAATFFLTYGANIPVARNILGPSATQQQVDLLNAQLGLDQPIFQQYWTWLSGLFTGDMGTSYFTSEPVASALASRLPVTLSVVLVASLITLLLSTLLGIASAARGGWLDSLLQSVATISYIFPAIVLGIVLVYVFAITLRLVPAIGFVPFSQSPVDWFLSVVLPAVVLAIGGIASLAAQIRGSMIDELNRDYIRSLRSRGSSEASILFRHALRNAAGPALTTFSLLFITMFGSSLFIEKIFALPGYGTFAFTSTIQGDLPAMLGVTLFSVVLVVVVNLLVDVLQAWLNPKVRTS